MDKFFNAFGFGVAVLLATAMDGGSAARGRMPEPPSTLASQSRNAAVELASAPAQVAVVTDLIAVQGNAAVRSIEEDARIAAQKVRAN